MTDLQSPTAEPWRLSESDSAAFVDTLLNPPEPNDALKAAAARYKTMCDVILTTLRAEGWLIVAPGCVPMPRSLDEAKAMSLLAEQYIGNCRP